MLKTGDVPGSIPTFRGDITNRGVGAKQNVGEGSRSDGSPPFFVVIGEVEVVAKTPPTPQCPVSPRILAIILRKCQDNILLQIYVKI